MHNGVLLIKEAPTSIALAEASNLVCLSGPPDVGQVYHRRIPSENPLSLNPDLFDGGRLQLACYVCCRIPIAKPEISKGNAAVSDSITFKEVWGQRQINADRVSFDGGLVHFRHFNRASRASIQGGPPIKANSYGRCFRINTEFSGRLSPRKILHRYAVQRSGRRVGTRLSRDHFDSSNLDRILKDNQGGCLYEWPCSQNVLIVAQRGRWKLRSENRREVYPILQMSGPSGGGTCLRQETMECLSVTFKAFWQKPGIGVRPSDRSSSLMALPRGKDNRVLSMMTPRALVLQAGSNLPRKGVEL